MRDLLNAYTLWGLGLAVSGVLLRWRMGRYDLKDKALASAFQTLRGKRSADNPTQLERELSEVTSQATLAGKATKAAGKVAGHFMAQAAAITGLGLLVVGAILALYGVFGR